MSRTTKKTISGSLILLILAMLIAILGQSLMVAHAQGDANVIILPSIGGTTDPLAGNYTYANGTEFVLTAIPDAGYTFQYWTVSGDYTSGHGAIQTTYIVDPDTGDIIGQIPRINPNANSTIDSLTFTANPANISHGYGYTYIYQAVFTPLTEPTPTPTNVTTPTNDTAIVIMEPSVGGTTNPPQGVYAYPNGTSFTFTATPNPGYTFQFWVVNGNVTPGHTAQQFTILYDDNGNVIAQIPRANTNTTIDSLTFTTNPVNVSHGYGYTYAYTAVFAPIPAATASPSPTVTASPTAAPTASPSPTPEPSSGFPTIYIVAIVVVVIIIIIVAVAAVMMRRKK